LTLFHHSNTYLGSTINANNFADHGTLMRSLLLFLSLVCFLNGYAQDDDYFPGENTKEIKQQNRNQLSSEKFPHHEKLTLHVFGNVALSQINDLYGVFDKTTPGFGGDAGVGLKVRLYRKLSLILGGTYSSKLWDVEFNAIDPNGNIGYAKEKGRVHYAGAYLKIQLDFTRRFWLALHFEQLFPVKFEGKEQTYTVGGVVYQWIRPNETSFQGGLMNQFDLGIDLGLNFPILSPVGLRPFLGIQFGTKGFAHTGARGNKLPFMREGEINPPFIHLKLGAIFDIPLLAARPAEMVKRKH